MRTIFCHKASILDGTGIFRKEKTYAVAELAVLAQNDEFLVLNDRYFTSVRITRRKNDSDIYPAMGKASIGIYMNDNCFGSGVSYMCYSNERLSDAWVKAEIKAAIEKKAGFFLQKIDLSFIKTPARLPS